MEVVASLSQGRTTAAQCGLFTYKSVPVIFEPPCNCLVEYTERSSAYYSCCPQYMGKNPICSTICLCSVFQEGYEPENDLK